MLEGLRVSEGHFASSRYPKRIDPAPAGIKECRFLVLEEQWSLCGLDIWQIMGSGAW